MHLRNLKSLSPRKNLRVLHVLKFLFARKTEIHNDSLLISCKLDPSLLAYTYI